MGDLDKAKELFEQIPALLDKKKIGGKDLPTEVFIKKKSALQAWCASRVVSDIVPSCILQREAKGIYWVRRQLRGGSYNQPCGRYA